MLNDPADNLGLGLESRADNVIGTDQSDAISWGTFDNLSAGNAGADVFTVDAMARDPTFTAGTDTVTDIEDGTGLVRLAVQGGGGVAVVPPTVAADGTDFTITHDDGTSVLAEAPETTITSDDVAFS